MNLRANNNFDFIRFIASSMVLFSHSYALINIKDFEPLAQITNGSLNSGRLAVIIFFIISGFLVSASWDNRSKLYSFMKARALRIFPALAVMLILTVIAGFFITTNNANTYTKSAILYFIKNVTLYKGTFELAGVFLDNPYGQAVNGSLWTLRLEFTCYIIVGTIGALGQFNKKTTWLIWTTALIISLTNGIPTNFFHELFPLLTWFSSGILAYLYRDSNIDDKIKWLLIATTIPLVALGISLATISPLISFYFVKLIYKKSPFTNFGKYGDFSYGIYIYAFPIQQYTIYLMTKSILSPMEWWVVFFVSFPATLLLSIASWHIIEKRFIARSKTSRLSTAYTTTPSSANS